MERHTVHGDADHLARARVARHGDGEARAARLFERLAAITFPVRVYGASAGTNAK